MKTADQDRFQSLIGQHLNNFESIHFTDSLAGKPEFSEAISEIGNTFPDSDPLCDIKRLSRLFTPKYQIASGNLGNFVRMLRAELERKVSPEHVQQARY